MPLHPWDAFLKLNVDSQLSGHTVLAVQLELTVTDATQAHSNNSGVVYKSTAFTAAELSIAEPAKAQAAAIAPSQGAVATLQTPGASVYLELETPSTDGVFYWDNLGMTPPQLRVYYQ